MPMVVSGRAFDKSSARPLDCVGIVEAHIRLTILGAKHQCVADAVRAFRRDIRPPRHEFDHIPLCRFKAPSSESSTSSSKSSDILSYLILSYPNKIYRNRRGLIR